MRPLPAAELLNVWERGHAEPPVRQALLLLSAAHPEMPLEQIGRLPIGRRDSLLLELREHAFGPTLRAVANCPGCRDALDLTFTWADIRAEDAEHAGTVLAVGGWEVEVRPPDSLDLLSVSDAVGEALPGLAGRLLQRCVGSITQDGRPADARDLPEEVLDAVRQSLADLDPQADVRLALTCPGCGRGWDAPFDVVSYFWGEIHSWALRVLQDIHDLASTYGWREADILALSPLRRKAYLELVRG